MNVKSEEKQVIEEFCFECCSEDIEKVKICPYTKCPLWKYRLKNKKSNLTKWFLKGLNMKESIDINKRSNLIELESIKLLVGTFILSYFFQKIK